MATHQYYIDIEQQVIATEMKLRDLLDALYLERECNSDTQKLNTENYDVQGTLHCNLVTLINCAKEAIENISDYKDDSFYNPRRYSKK